MSGTSLDGISCAVVRFDGEPDRSLTFDLIGFTSREYSAEQRERLSRALAGDAPEAYCRLNFDLGGWFADAVVATIAESGVARSDVAAVASHGQTVWHVPGHSTWQIGEAAVIAERTGINVISDFRVRDVAAGGQGAPLVPMADALLFAAPDKWRVLQNLGGIGNLSVVPGLRAFDTGPGVVIIDSVTRALYPDLPYDVDGKLASAGKAVASVVDQKLRHPFFSAEPPKSTGRELFTPDYIRAFIDDCRARGAKRDEDIIATAVEFTARSIALAFKSFIAEPVSELVLSGGGAKNPALVRAITDALPGINVLKFDDVYFDSEAKEAVAFALLGYLYLIGTPGNVPTATGARGPRILGKLTLA